MLVLATRSLSHSVNLSGKEAPGWSDEERARMYVGRWVYRPVYHHGGQTRFRGFPDVVCRYGWYALYAPPGVDLDTYPGICFGRPVAVHVAEHLLVFLGDPR